MSRHPLPEPDAPVGAAEDRADAAGGGAADTTEPGSAKGRERRAQILDRMIRMIADRGVDASSLRSLAEALGISHTALRHYFSSRDELLIAVYREHSLRRPSLAAGRGTAVEQLRDGAVRNRSVPGLVELYTTLAADAVQGNHPLAREFAADRFRRVRATVTELVQRDQAAGRIRADLDARAVATLLIAASDGLQEQWLLDPDAVDTERVLALFGRIVAGPDTETD